MHTLIPSLNLDKPVTHRAETIFEEQLKATHKVTDRRFAWLMGVQWLAGIVAALWISPRAWDGQYSHTHINVWAAIFLGGMISGFPIFMAIMRPGSVLTRHVIAVGQMLSCGLLIHLTGGRIETHFQYFGALAFLAFYRDRRVLLTASVVAAVDHFARGLYWPQSLFGVLVPSAWRALEHVGWIAFEDIFLLLAIGQNLKEMRGVANRQAQLETVNEIIERKVEERTSELSEEMIVRKNAEGTLRESDEKFRQMAENITDMFWMTSPDMRQVLYVSPAYEVIWGRSAESLYAHPSQWADAIPAEDRERVFTLFSSLGNGVSSASTEFQIIRPDGEERCVHGRGFPVRDAAGKVIRLTGIAADITEHKRNQQKLNVQYAMSFVLAEVSTMEQAESRILQTLCENLGWDAAGLWIVDSSGDVLRNAELWSAPNLQVDDFTAASRQITFARGTGLPGRVWESAKPAWIPDVVQDANFPRSPAARKAGLHGAFGFPVLIKSEVYAVVELFSREPRAPDDGLLLIAKALSNQIGQFFQRKKLEDHLLQSQKMETVGKLAGGVAHEFNSILTAIIGQSELLLNDLPPDDPLSKTAQEIRNAADRATALTRQLLAYGRKQILQPEILDLNQVLARLAGTLQHLAGKEVDMQIVPAIGLKMVKIDPSQMEQVIVNIVMNAADAMPNGGKLTVETANVTLDEDFVRPFTGLKPGEYVRIAITDTGVGMSNEVKARVFEPFFSTKGVGEGTGLGLATCYGILKQSNGHINVYSEVGRGSTFKIYLPQVEQQPQSSAPRAKSPGLPRGTETILLAEDDSSLLEMSATLLRRLGYTVLTAVNGIEAMNLKQQRNIGHIDLLFTDLIMPHMNGKELSDRIRAIYPHTKILFTSAYTESAIVHQGLLNEGVTLLQKPFTPSALANKVREVLDESSLSQG